MFILDADEQPLAASIVGNDATATTYSINCPPGTPGDECGMGPGMTLIAAGETTSYIFYSGEAFQYTAECSVGNSRAVCTESAGGSEANFPGVSTTTTAVKLMPVTVTAGEVTETEAASQTGTGDEPTPTGAAGRVAGAVGLMVGAVAIVGAVL
ncbi:putative GPI anchored protein [Aspergillus lucknowensis]|uniref:GPI anchored protein n=1 Tax=Aspergillus lucknowensis TaxID=176173 RepID=A0ABR4LLG9_9EURO